jgi:transcriptional regulator with XRE-family HTH domain
MASFGEMVRAGRMARGLTQRQLADALGQQHTIPSQWEHDRRVPDLEMTVRLADFLGLEVGEFIRARVEAGKALRASRDPAKRAAERAAEAASAAASALGESPERRRRGGSRPRNRRDPAPPRP